MEKIITVFLVCIMPLGYGYIIYFLIFKNKKSKLRKCSEFDSFNTNFQSFDSFDSFSDETSSKMINPTTGFEMNGGLDTSGKCFGERND